MTETKHMTLDDLLDEFKRTVERQPWSSALGYDAHRAGIRAVVEALRDACYGCEHHLLWDEILASDGVDKAGTHGSPELDEDARKLEAMGQDAGPTVQDLFPEVFVPAADRIEALEAEVERLRAALLAIAVRAGTFEGRGSYIAYVELAGEIEKMADAARNGEEPFALRQGRKEL